MEEFAVLAPLGRPARAALTHPPRLTSLDGRRVAFVWDEIFRGDEMFAVIAQELTTRWPCVEFVGHEHFGNRLYINNHMHGARVVIRVDER